MLLYRYEKEVAKCFVSMCIPFDDEMFVMSDSLGSFKVSRYLKHFSKMKLYKENVKIPWLL